MKILTTKAIAPGQWRSTASLCVVILGVAILFSCSASSNAQGTLAYSFETGLEGFERNGVNTFPVVQDTIGATDGSHSLKMELHPNATYVGALTGQIDPTIIGDPPGVLSMTFDLTLTATFPEAGFVDLFVVFFGLAQGTTEPGLEVSFQDDETNRVGIGDLAPGTYPIRMEFNSAIHPITLGTGSFNDIFGTEGSGPDDVIPVGFQITVNKSTQAPWVGYFDNFRFSSTAGTPGDFDGDGDVDGRDFLVWQRGETTPALDPGLLAEWQDNYGTGGLAAVTAVPEPTSALLLLLATGGLIASRKLLRGRYAI